MATLIITEKTSQAKDLAAALGSRYGKILPAEGHLLRLAEPDEIDPAWKRWSCTLLKPDGLYPTRPASGGNKSAKLEAIAAALKSCETVIIATDCDREGQLIGQEILEHLRYRGSVQRALFTAQDPKTLRQAFATLKPNHEMRPLYEAAVARQQADQIFNLSLTRTATKTLLAPGARGVIGIGRVKTPTLGIVCLRELEIRNFRPEDYFEVVAQAQVAGGSFAMRHAPPAKQRIKDRARAEAIARAADGYRGPLGVKVEHCRQGPPKLFDLPSLQKTCGQRWGWTADKTLAIAQELYDGDGKKLITYPRAEARYLSENQIADVPAITAALTGLRGFAHLDLSKPVIRKGKSGHFCDRALEGVSHHAVVPNVNVLDDDLEKRLARLSDDEKRLFAIICRSYLAAVMPDYEYRQTAVTLCVPAPPGERRISGGGAHSAGAGLEGGLQRQRAGCRRRRNRADPAAAHRWRNGPAHRTARRRQAHAGSATLQRRHADRRHAKRLALRGKLGVRERLKEAKGIGTPATRAEIIKGLKRQNLLAADGKWVVPTSAGLQVFEVLREAAPALVDPGTTAEWEMQLDAVVTGKADHRHVIDAIAGEAGKLIGVLQQRERGAVDLTAAPAEPEPRKRRSRRTAAAKDETAVAKPSRRKAASAKPKRPRRGKAAQAESAPETSAASRAAPTARMVAYAEKLAKAKKLPLPPGYAQDFQACRRFLDQYG